MHTILLIQVIGMITMNWWKKELPNAQLYVDEEEGEIAGFVGMQGDYIAGIFVKRDHRGRGIGGKLIDFLKLKHDKLQLSVYEKNEAALSFYQNRGFKLVKKRDWLRDWCSRLFNGVGCIKVMPRNL